VALADGFAARTCLEAERRAARYARMSKDREAKLDLRIRNQRQKTPTCALAYHCLRKFSRTTRDAWIALPAETEWSRFHWNAGQ